MPDSSFFSLPRIDKQNIPWMTLLLVAANVAVFIWIEINGSAADSDFMLSMGAAYAPSILIDHEYYRLFTHMFLHFGFMHLFNNMISLIILGYTTEHVLGRVRFLLLYLLSGIGGGLLSLAYCVSIHENNVSAGASGAIFGLLGALLIMLLRGSRGQLSSRIVPFLIYLLIALYSGFLDTTIDHAGHLGGFVTGMIVCLIMSLGGRKLTLDVGGPGRQIRG